MSQELERVYTIPLGKVLLSPDNRRAKRAINMIKEFARHHMKNEDIRIEEDVSHAIWERGIRSPPRKIRVRMTKTDEGFILVSPYDEEIESEVKPKEKEKKPAPKVEKTEEIVDEKEESAEPVEELDKTKTSSKKDVEEILDAAAPKKDEPKKDEPKKDAPKKDAPKKDEPKKDAPKKEVKKESKKK